MPKLAQNRAKCRVFFSHTREIACCYIPVCALRRTNYALQDTCIPPCYGGGTLIVGQAWAWPGRVVAVTDGDTVTIEKLADGSRIKIWLHGIDAPERKQSAGEIARAFVFEIALYKMVEIEEKDWDRYGSLVAVLWVSSGESLQEALLKNGLALVWPRYCRDCRDWEKLQENARQNRRGFWANPDAIAPWEWRRGTRP